MKREKGRLYLVLALLLILAAVLLPFVINLVSDTMVKKILEHRETEISTESETSTEELTEKEMESEKEMTVLSIAEAAAGEEKAASGTEPAGEETKQKEEKASEPISDEKAKDQENYIKDMQRYVADFQPENVFYINLPKEDKKFLMEREPEFLKALAEYLYSMYGDQITVSKVVILGEIGSDDFEEAFYFTVETDDGESEGFYCVYDKEQDFFSLYSMMMG